MPAVPLTRRKPRNGKPVARRGRKTWGLPIGQAAQLPKEADLKIITLTRIAVASAALALAAGPAFAQQPEGTPTKDDNTGTTHQPSTSPTNDDNPGAERKLAAPGRYCKAASKKRGPGQKGTPFSFCVRAQAKLRKGTTDSPREACKGASKKHAGQKGTPFSICVSAGAKLLKDKKALEESTPSQS